MHLRALSGKVHAYLRCLAFSATLPARPLTLLLLFAISAGVQYGPPLARAQTNQAQGEGGTPGSDPAGEGAFARGEELRARWEEGALREAASEYLEAASSWKETDPRRAAAALLDAGDIYFILTDYGQALKEFGGALELSRSANDRGGELDALNRVGYAQVYLGENQLALRRATEVQRACERLAPKVADDVWRRRYAYSLNTVGEVYYALGNLKGSIKMFRRALTLWEAGGDPGGVALAHLNLGYSYTDSADTEQAAEHYRQSLLLWREVGDRRGEALAQTALGSIYSFQGSKQQALCAHSEALSLFHLIGNRQGEAAAINGVAQAYEDLHEYSMALENYQQALVIYQAIGNRDFIALNKYYVGRVYHSMSDSGRARESYDEALALSREAKDQQIEAHILRGLGVLDTQQGDNDAALGRFRQVLNLYGGIGDRRSVAYTLNDIGNVYLAAGESRRALSYFRRALPLIRSAEDRRGEALVLYNMASVERDAGDSENAIAHVGESIRIIEASRAKVESRELRTSYFAQEHKHYELYIDLLMQKHKEQPAAGYAAAAFLASEHARARSLLDTLTEARPDNAPDERAALVKREAELSGLLEAKSEHRTQLLNGARHASEVAEVTREINAITSEYEALQARLREQDPRHAALTQPAMLRLEDIQAELPDDSTLLVEFSLGEKRSYFWVVSSDSVVGYELPGRAAIEAAADRVYKLVTTRQLVYEGKLQRGQALIKEADAAYFSEALALSRMLFGPVADRLTSQRLLIVPDGALQYVPFEALPALAQPASGGVLVEGGQPQLLIDRHEVITLPSASILAAIRREAPRPNLSTKTVIVVADPVFDKDDPRVLRASAQGDAGASQEEGDVYLQEALRDWNGEEANPAVPRLPASLQEAKAIMANVPRGEGTIITGFEANRMLVDNEELKDYRIVHFATHGILNSDRPELSGLVLSLVDRGGNPQNGYLRLRDIYNLKLPADLVVLSACRTGLGKSVQGEGLIGLTRGFMYAGSRGVVASLWKVDDAATAALMKRFYEAMLRDGMQPEAALRAAKQSVRAQEQWRSPYFWAAFVLQGEYTEKFAPERKEVGTLQRLATPLLVTTFLLLAVLFLFLRRRRRQYGSESSSFDGPGSGMCSHVHHTD